MFHNIATKEGEEMELFWSKVGQGQRKGGSGERRSHEAHLKKIKIEDNANISNYFTCED
jgi:hypothetical protein